MDKCCPYFLFVLQIARICGTIQKMEYTMKVKDLILYQNEILFEGTAEIVEVIEEYEHRR